MANTRSISSSRTPAGSIGSAGPANRHMVDPELRPWLESRSALTPSAETLLAYRKMILDMVSALPKPIGEAAMAVRCDEKLIPGPANAPDVRVLVYTPTDSTAAPWPAYLHIHGGGFVAGTAAMSDPNNRICAVEMNCVVVSVDYRLAPETPFPGPVEDCYAALLWLHSNASALNVEPGGLPSAERVQGPV